MAKEMCRPTLAGRVLDGNSERAGQCYQGGRIMNWKSSVVLLVLSRFLVVAVCTSLAAVLPARAAQLATSVPTTQLADGIWTVQGRAISGTRRCGDWLVRLTNARGRLSGVVSLVRGSVPIQNLARLPDGSFWGTTQAGLVGSTHARV